MQSEHYLIPFAGIRVTQHSIVLMIERELFRLFVILLFGIFLDPGTERYIIVLQICISFLRRSKQ